MVNQNGKKRIKAKIEEAKVRHWNNYQINHYRILLMCKDQE